MTPLRTASEASREKTGRNGPGSADGPDSFSPLTGQTASLAVRGEGGATRLVFTGELTAHTLNLVRQPLQEALREARAEVLFDLGGLSRLDTSGALLINLSLQALRDKGGNGRVLDPSGAREKLLTLSVLPEPELKQEKAPVPPAWQQVIESYGKSVCQGLLSTGELVSFLGRFLLLLGRLTVRPREMRWTSLVFHMEQVGLRAVPIVSLLTFLIGLVVAYMGAQQLAMFGADIFAVNLLEVMVLREMAVLITAIVVAGRSSSSFTAQIGAMVANEEVDALRSMGLDPGTLLVVPRVLALIVTLPMLVFLADVMALLGGALAIWITLDINFMAFLTQLESVAKLGNFMVGMVKTPFFAMSIGLVGCFQGFRASGSAESVGFLTTIAVVQSIFIVILLDALFAMFFTTIGV